MFDAAMKALDKLESAVRQKIHEKAKKSFGKLFKQKPNLSSLNVVAMTNCEKADTIFEKSFNNSRRNSMTNNSIQD